jgi:hypothetical protein
MTIYYAGQVHKEYRNISPVFPLRYISKELREESREIYNGCYIHLQGFGSEDGWYTADQIPAWNVPKELQLLALITT